jgi:hypothetical protein
MKRKLINSTFLACITSLLIVGIVFAGSTRDWGQLVGTPPVGEVNYYAWIGDELTSNGMPKEIITEDAYNSSDGPNGGYIYFTDSGAIPPFAGPIWRIQARNITGIANNDPVSMVFGGISGSSGSTWYFDFLNTLAPSIKYWDTPVTKSTGDACPTRYPAATVDQTTTVMFFGKPNRTYQVYRSTMGSGFEPDNGLSNGHYQYFVEVLTDQYGIGYIIDNDWENIQYGSWYEILYFDVVTGLSGCHSEPVGPNSVNIADLSATYNPGTNSVNIDWVTVSDVSFRGFNVMRSESEHGLQSKINPEMIDVYQIGSVLGNIYTYTDDSIALGKTYYYWLEVIEIDDSIFTFGPESVTTGYIIFIPLLVK